MARQLGFHSGVRSTPRPTAGKWAEGYAPRFELYAVDYATQARTLRESGDLYGQIARVRSCS